ncbi:winged helix-turn-helix transcriptional regulator [Pseudomonas sp. AO-1]|uniref:winged helix-turn-helix transcriptional regulator n=1 Tax=Pseudomonas sp. AO-1 TaxID=2855434 RepID=UPI001C75AA3A|nr:winged helix-turn-helix transcriptional regulator [Pseudomonas sp. AO-1]QXZ13538.1 winged helix-turn-helix transcriptional regulator [Pseudomonas sp. AO-1]
MNEKTYIIALRDFTDEINPYGTFRGKQTYARLLEYIDKYKDASIIGVSFSNLEGADTSFLRESLIYIIKRYSKQITFFAFDFLDEDIFENLKSAAISGKERLTCWVGSQCRFAGQEPTAASKPLLELVISHRSTTTAKVAEELSISVQNASTRLKRLAEEGFLMRVEEAAETGGKEFIYQVVGKSA